MTHVDNNLLKQIRFEARGRCEFCGDYALNLEVHHLWGRKLGGGSRLDVRPNLIALCRRYEGLGGCHNRTELAGKDKLCRSDLLKIVARRENTTPRAIECVMGWLSRLDKDSSPERVERSFELLNPDAAALGRRVWQEIQQSKAKRRSA